MGRHCSGTAAEWSRPRQAVRVPESRPTQYSKNQSSPKSPSASSSVRPPDAVPQNHLHRSRISSRLRRGLLGSSTSVATTSAESVVKFACTVGSLHATSKYHLAGASPTCISSTEISKPLVCGRFGGASPGVAGAQRLSRHTQVGSDMRDWPARLEHHPRAALQQLRGVLPRSRHERSVSSPQDRTLRSRSPSNRMAHDAARFLSSVRAVFEHPLGLLL